jgi:hypothetical protein
MFQNIWHKVFLIYLIIVFLFKINSVYAQKCFLKKIRSVSCPERYWAITHPFIANKAFKISVKAKQTAYDLIKDTLLDHDYNGGQVDAFRHAFWMSCLVRKIKPQKAYKLGYAHEKGNFRNFKKHKTEDGTLQDSIASAMDLYNNKIGIEIGLEHINVPEDTLKKIIIQAILNGKMKIIKKTKTGESLDTQNNIIKNSEWQGKWINARCLVNSNFYRP